MSYLADFLQQLDDVELAYFYKYRFQSFLPESKSKIAEEFKRRKLSPEDSNSIIKKSVSSLSVDKDGVCPRCKSNKYYIGKKKIYRTIKGIIIEKEINQFICQICEYIDNDSPKLLKNIIKFFNNIFS